MAKRSAFFPRSNPKPRIRPEHKAYFDNLSEKAKAAHSIPTYGLLSEIADWMAETENLYCYFGLTKDKTSLVFTLCYGQDAKFPVYSGNLKELFELVDSKLSELSDQASEGETEDSEEAPNF